MFLQPNSLIRNCFSRAIEDTKPDVVVFDSLYNVGIGDLNHDEDMFATLRAVSFLTKTGNPERVPLVLQHATFCATSMVGTYRFGRMGEKCISHCIYRVDLCVASKRKKTCENAIFAILNPVRLPFRHTGKEADELMEFR